MLRSIRRMLKKWGHDSLAGDFQHRSNMLAPNVRMQLFLSGPPRGSKEGIKGKISIDRIREPLGGPFEIVSVVTFLVKLGRR